MWLVKPWAQSQKVLGLSLEGPTLVQKSGKNKSTSCNVDGVLCTACGHVTWTGCSAPHVVASRGRGALHCMWSRHA